MSVFRPAMTRHYRLKLLNHVACTEWACLVVYTVRVLALFCFRFRVTNPVCTVQQLHLLPVQTTIASYPAVLTDSPATPSHFQWICLDSVAKQFWRRQRRHVCPTVNLSVIMKQCNSHLMEFFLWNFIFRICIKICLYIQVLFKIRHKITTHFTWIPACIYDSISPLLFFITETDCVLCEVWVDAEEILNDLNMSIIDCKSPRLQYPGTYEVSSMVDHKSVAIIRYVLCKMRKETF
jgi:hypothetical protein